MQGKEQKTSVPINEYQRKRDIWREGKNEGMLKKIKIKMSCVEKIERNEKDGRER